MWIVISVLFVFGVAGICFEILSKDKKEVGDIFITIGSLVFIFVSGCMLDSVLFGDSEVMVKDIYLGQMFERADMQFMETSTLENTTGTCVRLREIILNGTNTVRGKSLVYFVPQGEWYPPTTNTPAVCVKYNDGTKRLVPYFFPSTNTLAEATMGK